MSPMKLPLFSILATAALLAAGSASAQGYQQGFPDLTTGKAVFEGICQGCHMPDAKGAVGAGMYPALAGNAKLKVAAYPILVVTRGQKAMPEFGSSLTDAQIAGVVNYIRTNFGNANKDAVTEAQVKAMRPR
jgi:mono/diheme cytochrome c family protein